MRDPPLGFADKLFETIHKDLLHWTTGTNSFVVVGMAESRDLSVENRKLLGEMLKKDREDLNKAAKGQDGKGNKGAGILSGMIEKGEL